MIPEDQLKPNFERFVVMLIGGETVSPDNTERIAHKRNNILKEWELEWEAILNGEIPYTENPKLIDLLKKNQLESLFGDFRFLGYKISEYINENWDYITKVDCEDKMDLELLKALKILNEPKEDIIIRFHGKENKTSISNPTLVELIKEKLREILKETDIHFKDYPDDHLKWREFILRRIESHKFNSSYNRGRKEKNPEIKRTINWLHRYLEYNTPLKRIPGKIYSNEQARFIYNFFDIYGLIKDSEEKINKEDIIGFYIKSAQKSKENRDLYFRELCKKFFNNKG